MLVCLLAVSGMKKKSNSADHDSNRTLFLCAKLRDQLSQPRFPYIRGKNQGAEVGKWKVCLLLFCLFLIVEEFNSEDPRPLDIG